MARQKTILVTGKMDNLIFYEFRGKPCVRTMPQTVRQTKATRDSAGNFGLINRISKNLRASLHDFVPNSRDPKFMYKVNNEVRQWLANRKNKKTGKSAGLPLVNRVDCNEEALIENRFPIELQLAWGPGMVSITIPEINPRQQLPAPPHTETIQLRIAIGGCEVAKEKPVKNKIVQVEIPYRNELLSAQTLTIPVNFNSDTLAILAMDLHYEKTQKSIVSQTIANKQWKPCGVIGSYYY